MAFLISPLDLCIFLSLTPGVSLFPFDLRVFTDRYLVALGSGLPVTSNALTSRILQVVVLL